MPQVSAAVFRSTPSGTSASPRNRLHPKVVRQALRLAFLSPDVTAAILEGRQPAGLSLAQIPKLLPLPWTEHRRLLDRLIFVDRMLWDFLAS
jgi:hypothetical protein